MMGITRKNLWGGSDHTQPHCLPLSSLPLIKLQGLLAPARLNYYRKWQVKDMTLFSNHQIYLWGYWLDRTVSHRPHKEIKQQEHPHDPDKPSKDFPKYFNCDPQHVEGEGENNNC